MAAQPQTIPGAGSVQAELRYIVDTGEKPRTYIAPQHSGRPSRREDTVDLREMRIHDAWPLVGEATLDREGFELHRQASQVSDFHDDEEVERVRYPEIEALIRRTTGARRVSVFDHTRRSAGDKRAGVRDLVRSVHNDYTPKSGPQRVRDLFPDEAEALLKRRFAVANAWHSIRDRVESHPLAVCDARSIDPGDLVATDLVYEDRVGEVYNLAHNPAHRWFYFPGVGEDETILLKCFDSAVDGRARFTAHTAFEDPHSVEGAPPRESMELRALVFFDD